MDGPRSARRRRSLLGFGQIAPTGASGGRPGWLRLRYPAIMDGRNEATNDHIAATPQRRGRRPKGS
jgi:hypothetical protein